MTVQFENPIVLEPATEAKACVIWLHGLGADGDDFVPIVPQLELPVSLGVRFVFPHARVQPVTINGGYQMRSWYDITENDLQRQPDLSGIAESVEYLQQLMSEQQRSGISLDKMVLAGFSQGGVVALDCALRLKDKPAGVMALSTYLAEAMGDATGLEVFQGHGLQDDIVPKQAGLAAANYLRSVGARVDWREYAMAHSVHPQEISDIALWLEERLK